jgi:hypothetical protein
LKPDDVVREQVLQLLKGGNAHLPLDKLIDEFPPGAFNEPPPNVPYSPWHLLEHIRIAQWDILEFIRNPDHVSPEWPAGYWPPKAERADVARWQETVQALRSDMAELQAIVQDPTTDFYADLPHAEGYTILREMLVVADHNSHHLGEFAILRQVMGTWPS